jgi:biotin carboxyl carrier protein
MQKYFKVGVNEEIDFPIESIEVESLNLTILHGNFYHLIHQNKNYQIEILQRDFLNRRYEIKLNGKRCSLQIKNELDLQIEEMGLSKAQDTKASHVKAPMPGQITAVFVEVGQIVKTGETLLILEAMKMENAITATGEGVVKSIKIKKGDTVNKNQLMIDIE